MIYNLISGEEIVRRLANDHNMPIASELARIPKWIYQALEKLKLLTGYLPASYNTNIVDGFATLPSDIRYLIGIEYNGKRLERKGFLTEDTISESITPLIYDTRYGITVTGNVETVTYDEDTRVLSGNVTDIKRYDYMTILNAEEDNTYYYVLTSNKIESNLENGNIWIYYYKFPLEYSDAYSIEVPLIPDNEEVIEFITLYIIVTMLQKGIKHPVYDLTSNNEFINIGLKLKKAKIPALNSANAFDKDKSNNIVASAMSAFYNRIAKIY